MPEIPNLAHLAQILFYHPETFRIDIQPNYILNQSRVFFSNLAAPLITALHIVRPHIGPTQSYSGREMSQKVTKVTIHQNFGRVDERWGPGDVIVVASVNETYESRCKTTIGICIRFGIVYIRASL